MGAASDDVRAAVEAPRLVSCPTRPGTTRRRRVAAARRFGRRRRHLPCWPSWACLLVGLALPLGGSGGHSHPTGSALAEPATPVAYTVQPGDSLWTIAERAGPVWRPPTAGGADWRPQTGSDTVVPGEQIDLP